MYKYSKLTWDELLNKTNDWFNLPRFVTEALKRLKTLTDVKYKVYSVLINQLSTNDPEIIVLENTFEDNIVWERVSVGIYTGTLINTFKENKTWCTVSGISSQGDSFSVGVGRLDDNTIQISSKTLDASNANTPIYVDMNTEIPFSLEIRVYQ